MALPKRWRLLGLAVALVASAPLGAADRRQTVCTITINSANEKLAFMRHLPASRFRFVELVQPERPDWLGAACAAGVRCDVMIVSGHFDGGNEFFSDGAQGQESLRVSELERASCSDDCAGLFAQLKEVYLFGCNTLNPVPLSSATAEFVRSVVRRRGSRDSADCELARLGTVYGESSRERMRQIFNGVPAIYGFPSSAPLGPAAASALDEFFAAAGSGAVGRGRPSAGLFAQFAPNGLAVVRGVSEEEASTRWDLCKFADARLSDAQLARHVHRLLRRDIAQVGQHLDRIQRLVSALLAQPVRSAALAAALRDIADDFISRIRLLDAARSTDEAASSVRLLDLARDLGWLTLQEHRQQLGRLFATVEGRAQVGLGEIDLACALNRDHALDGALDAAPGAPAEPQRADHDLSHAALRACLGSMPGRARLLEALASTDEGEVQIAQTYLRHRPIADAAELGRAVAAVADMAPSDAQVRALEALARHDVEDAASIARLTRLYAETAAWSVQVAIAGILIRVDKRALPREALLQLLRERRLPWPAGENRIDALMSRLQAP